MLMPCAVQMLFTQGQASFVSALIMVPTKELAAQAAANLKVSPCTSMIQLWLELRNAKLHSFVTPCA